MFTRFSKNRPKLALPGKISPGQAKFRTTQWCNCIEILSRRRGFVCLTGARPCPHCGLRVPVKYHREIMVKRDLLE